MYFIRTVCVKKTLHTIVSIRHLSGMTVKNAHARRFYEAHCRDNGVRKNAAPAPYSAARRAGPRPSCI